MNETKLKICPFCGSDEEFLSVVEYAENVYGVLCCECGGKGGNCETEQEAKETWNRRPQNVIILPCAIDTKVWVLATPCGGCPCYNEPMKEEFFEICRNCDLWEIGECRFDYELIPEFGKLVFLTKEEAEQALKEKIDNAKSIGTADEIELLKGGVRDETQK